MNCYIKRISGGIYRGWWRLYDQDDVGIGLAKYYQHIRKEYNIQCEGGHGRYMDDFEFDAIYYDNIEDPGRG